MTHINYFVEDSRNLEKIFKIKKLKNADMILTSPPYFDIKNYENKSKQIGYGQIYTDYVNDIINVLHQCYNISSEKSTFWLIMDSIRRDGRLIPLPFNLINKLNNKHDKTWILKDIIIWNKYKNVPWHHKGNLKNHFEYIFFLSKNDNYKYHIDRVREIADLKKWWISYPERYNPRGKSPTNIWEFTTPIRGWGNGCQKHFCPFPFQLVEKIISISTDPGDLILDPFAGSGSVLAIAKQMERDSIGIDVNKEYKKRFEEEVFPGAERYWNRRTKELSKINENINNFYSLNMELRKMKLCSNIANFLSENISNKTYRYFCLNSKRKNDSNINIIAVSNGKNNLKSDFTQILIEEIQQVSDLFKLKVSFEVKDFNDFTEQYCNIHKYYEYNTKKPNIYEREIQKNDITFKDLKVDKIYSDIGINITKTKDFL